MGIQTLPRFLGQGADLLPGDGMLLTAEGAPPFVFRRISAVSRQFPIDTQHFPGQHFQGFPCLQVGLLSFRCYAYPRDCHIDTPNDRCNCTSRVWRRSLCNKKDRDISANTNLLHIPLFPISYSNCHIPKTPISTVF